MLKTNIRPFLWVALGLVLFLNFQMWQRDYAPPPGTAASGGGVQTPALDANAPVIVPSTTPANGTANNSPGAPASAASTAAARTAAETPVPTPAGAARRSAGGCFDRGRRARAEGAYRCARRRDQPAWRRDRRRDAAEISAEERSAGHPRAPRAQRRRRRHLRPAERPRRHGEPGAADASGDVREPVPRVRAARSREDAARADDVDVRRWRHRHEDVRVPPRQLRHRPGIRGEERQRGCVGSRVVRADQARDAGDRALVLQPRHVCVRRAGDLRRQQVPQAEDRQHRRRELQADDHARLAGRAPASLRERHRSARGRRVSILAGRERAPVPRVDGGSDAQRRGGFDGDRSRSRCSSVRSCSTSSTTSIPSSRASPTTAS